MVNVIQYVKYYRNFFCLLGINRIYFESFFFNDRLLHRLFCVSSLFCFICKWNACSNTALSFYTVLQHFSIISNRIADVISCLKWRTILLLIFWIFSTFIVNLIERISDSLQILLSKTMIVYLIKQAFFWNCCIYKQFLSSGATFLSI